MANKEEMLLSLCAASIVAVIMGRLQKRRLGQLLRFFRALQTSRVLHNSIVHAKAWANNIVK